jgi:ribonuclease P protein component
VIFTSPLENSDLELRVTVTASVPGESNHDVVGPRGVEPRTVGARAVEPRSVELRSGKGAFPRSARLLRHADFERVYKQGRRHFSASMTVFYWQRPQADVVVAKGPAAKPPVAPGLRIGFTVSRALGGAVQRNRMKRRLREAVRFTRPPAGPNADVVINPKKSLLTVDFTAVVNEVGRAFVVIEEKLAGKTGTVAGTEQKSSGSRKPKA